MKGNFRISPIKIRVVFLTKKHKLTLGRFRSSFKLLFKSSFKQSTKKLYINNLELTTKILNNAYNKSIN